MTEKQILTGIRATSILLTAILLLSLPEVQRIIKPAAEDLLMMVNLEQILFEREEQKPKPLPIPVAEMSSSPRADASPVIAPTEMKSKPSQITVAEPSLDKPVFGMVHELFDKPPDDRPQTKLSPNASPMPDILTQRADVGEARPPSGITAPVTQSGRNYQGSGAPDLLPAITPGYTGPNLNLPESVEPSVGLTKGDQVATSPTPGIARGETYNSSVGSKPGQGEAESIGIGQDLVGEGEISGLVAWLKANPGAFSPVLMAYLESDPGDLKGITSYAGWDIFIQYSQSDGQLKIFLSRGDQGILLADSDFKNRSQFLGLGSVARTGQEVNSVNARREKPTAQSTGEFYSVFYGWMSSKGINLAKR